MKIAPPLRRCLACALLLVAGTGAQAQDAAFEINPGLNDAWFYPPTAGQGFFINVFPGRGEVYLSWFTYDTERPPEDVTAQLGEPGHRWLTAQGPYTGDTAVLDVALTQGGTFDTPLPDPGSATTIIGTITIEWSDCNTADLSYDFSGLIGTIPLERVAPDNIALCEAFLTETPPVR